MQTNRQGIGLIHFDPLVVPSSVAPTIWFHEFHEFHVRQVIIASLSVSSCCLAFVLYDFLDIDPRRRTKPAGAWLEAG